MEKKVIGVITEILDERTLVFRSNNAYKMQLNKIVGIAIEDNVYLLGRIQKVETKYFLNNSEEYFTSLASDDRLSDLYTGSRNPKHSYEAQVRYLGIYSYDEEGEICVETTHSIDIFTPKTFQGVIEFDFKEIVAVYGLNPTEEDTVKLGEFLYPLYATEKSPKVEIPLSAFNAHTLISGVTGAGKSRLTALIANQLAENGREIQIIDPHKEYPYLIKGKVEFFSEKNQKAEEYLEKILHSLTHLQYNEESFKTLIIDEAHTLLKGENGKRILSEMLRTSRKFGYAMIFISQNQADIPEEIRSQFQNYFSFREEQNENLRYVPDQTCICKLRKGKVDFPLRVDNVDLIKPE